MDDSSSSRLAATLRREWADVPAGRRLPPSRELVRRHRASAATVSRALAQLVAEGAITSRPGAGTFKAAVREAAAPGDVSWQEVSLATDPTTGQVGGAPDATGVMATLATAADGVIDLNGGYLHAGLRPDAALSAALARAGRRPAAWSRPPVEGVTELREWFARDIGPGTDPGGVLICGGGQAGLTIAARALGRPGAPAVVESPTYPGTLAALRMVGMVPVPVPVDEHGVRPELLAEALDSSRARLVVCQPAFHNPTGATMTAQRRDEIHALARAAGAFVVEDDFGRHLVHADAPALPAPMAADDPDGVVVHVRSLTKSTSANVRVAALCAKGPAYERLRASLVIDSMFVSRPLQEAVVELVTAAAWPRHVRTLATRLQGRRQALAAAVAALPGLQLPRVPHGGYHLWVRLLAGDPAEVAATALRHGVSVTPGHRYFPNEPEAGYLRLSHVAAVDEAQLAEGARRLGAALAALGHDGL